MEEFVPISTERLKELELLEASIPSMIEKAVAEYKKSNLKKLHERDKANPSAINLRVKRYVERHRDEINKRRREKRHKEKQDKYSATVKTAAATAATSATAAAATASKLDIENQLLLDNLDDDNQPVKVQSIFVRAANKTLLKSDIPIVRKQAKPHEDVLTQATTSAISDRINNVTVRFDI